MCMYLSVCVCVFAVFKHPEFSLNIKAQTLLNRFYSLDTWLLWGLLLFMCWSKSATQCSWGPTKYIYQLRILELWCDLSLYC